jgi:hypothetical protein
MQVAPGITGSVVQKPAVGRYQTAAGGEQGTFPLICTVAGEPSQTQPAGRGTGPGFPDAHMQFQTLQGNADLWLSSCPQSLI